MIISAGNKYLFPHKLIDKENISIINFHNALLQAYPGRNAPSRAIYNGEKYAGATWHMVTADVDAGAILCQKASELSSDTKAYEAARMIMELAYQGFEEILDMLFEGTIKAVPQIIADAERRIYYAKEIPGNGIVKLTDSAEYIYCVLRATDYGLNPVFPKIKLVSDNGEICVIKRYSKESYKEGINDEPLKKYYLKFEDGNVLRLNVDICTE